MTAGVFVQCSTLENGNILLGNNGGTSRVYGVRGINPMVGLIVETEHGMLCLDPECLVEIQETK